MSRCFIWGVPCPEPQKLEEAGRKAWARFFLRTSGRYLDFELPVSRIERKYISVVSSHSSHLTCGNLIWPPQEGKRE